MIRGLKRILSTPASTDVFIECRHCGTTLTADASACSACGSGEVAEYRFEH